MSDDRITWFVNDYEGRNSSGLGAYWGYLVGALDGRNIAAAHHAPLDGSQSQTETESRDQNNVDDDEDDDDDKKKKSSSTTAAMDVSDKIDQNAPPNRQQ